MNTQLAIIPPAVSTVIKPKPTRSELIDAMTALRMEQIQKESAQAEKKRLALKAKIEKASLTWVRRNFRTTKGNVRFYAYSSNQSASISVDFDITAVPPELVAMVIEHDKLKQIVYRANNAKERDTRREISQGFNQIAPRAERIDALLKNPSSRKALESALAELTT